MTLKVAKIFKKGFIFLFVMMMAFQAGAQDASGKMSGTETLLIVVISLVLFVAILLLIVSIYLIKVIRLILLEQEKKTAVEAGVELKEIHQSWWQKFMHSLTDSVPIEKEETVMLDHNYDGIRELDNHLPPWWKWLFYFTIAWGIVYFFVYHVFGLFPLSHEEYEREMEAARIAQESQMKLTGNMIDENTVEFTDDADLLAKGKAIFDRDCMPCHGPQGQGLIGPNFTDDYWIHGGSIKDIFKTIKYGVPQKGMISWQSKLSPTDMRNVASFVKTLRGTNPPNQKEPQGELYVPENENQDQNKEQPADSTANKVVMN